jgi:cytochrome c-type biogenesis protein CcmH/NrfF
MAYSKFLKCVPKVDTTKLALWVVLLVAIGMAGLVAMQAGQY